MKKNNVITIVIAFGLFLCLLACNSGASEAEQQTEAQFADLKNQLEQLGEKVPQLKALNERVAQDSATAEVYYTRGQLLSQLNAPELAVLDLSRAIRLDSSQANYYIATANIYFSGNHSDRAVQLLEQAKALMPSEANVLTQLGQYYFYLQQYDKAVENLSASIAQNPNNSQANFWLAMTYRDQKQPQKAIDALEKTVGINPDSYNAQMILAQLYSDEKNPKSITHYDKAITLDTLKVEAYYGKAMFYQITGQYDAALTAYKQLLLRDSQYTDAFYNIGYIFFHYKKQYDKAYTNFDIAIKTSPANAPAYFMRGQCAEKMGKKKEALHDYDKALTFDPELQDAQKALEALSK